MGFETIALSPSKTPISDVATENGTQDGTVNPENGTLDPDLERIVAEISAAWAGLSAGERTNLLGKIRGLLSSPEHTGTGDRRPA